jgi:secondary thiamine-phosphate synthase enzyme
MDTARLQVDTSARKVVDLTDEVVSFCRDRGDGLVSIFVPHSTAGLAVIEMGSRSDADLQTAVNRLLPRDASYEHAHGTPGHGADHLLPAFLAPSLTVPVADGRPLLGVWQSIVLVDLNVDNPRREVLLSFLRG